MARLMALSPLGYATFQTVHELCVLVAELTNRLISTSKAARNGSVEGVHLCELVIAQRTDTALDASQRTGSVLLVEASDKAARVSAPP